MEVKFRELNEEDKEYFYLWVRDMEVIKYSLSVFQKMKSNSDISKWFDSVLIDKTSYSRAIVDSNNNKLIGYAGIAQINKTNKSGEYFIFIGDKYYHGKGVGTFVTKEIVKNGFEELDLNRIMLTASEKNIGAIKAYTNANFKIEGVMRQAFYREGKFHNKIIMGILKEEWS